jgi:uncharacterized protein (DUF2141 family)
MNALARSLLFFAVLSPIANAIDITINVQGIRNKNGKIAALVFSNQNGFPSEVAKALAQARIDAVTGNATISLKNVPAGKIAITILHDENNNGKMDKNIVGIPKEGVAMTGKPLGNRPPKFDEAVIECTANKTLTLTLKYW